MPFSLRTSCLLFVCAWSLIFARVEVLAQTKQAKKKAAAKEKAAPAAAEKPAVPPSAAIVIPKEPRAIDPATLLPAKLVAPLTVEFKESSLSDVVKWLQTEQKLGVILEQEALSKEAGILTSDPLTEKSDKAPLYLLLDRLRTSGIGWYLQDELIHLTAVDIAAGKLRTVHYTVGDLFDAGYKSDDLLNTLTSVVDPNSWDDVGGSASVIALGDVLFVSQSQQNHREVAGLLAALRKHGQRTYTLDPPGHDKLRAALEQPVSIEVRDVPLSTAVQQLAKQAGAEIRIDRKGIDDVGVRERTPVTLALSDQKLSVVLTVLLEKHGLTWFIRDGALWITNPDEVFQKTAVYDVRDLCRDEGESEALQEAITSQLSSSDWQDVGGRGAIQFPLPGAMVVSQTEAIHDKLLELLENYRAALRISKPRQQPGKDPKEIVTHYYRMPEAMANDLVTALPKLLRPESWRSDNQPNAVGTIMKLASHPEKQIQTQTTAKKEESTVTSYVLIPMAVLVIKNQREVHAEIPELLWNLHMGAPFNDSRKSQRPFVTSVIPVVDSAGPYPGKGGGQVGGGLGGGGFGGGFFSVPSK